MYEHQRLMYYKIKNFLENGHSSCRIGVLTGLRRIGKTGILTDLTESMPNSLYVTLDSKIDQNTERDKLFEFLNRGSGYLFIDEVTHLNQYEGLIETILYDVYNKYPNLKVIISGSSSLHLLWLFSGPLGGGRSELFNLSFLSFTEYLKLTGRISSYANLSAINEEHFREYLVLKDLNNTGLDLVFGDSYITTVYEDLLTSNRCARSPGNYADLKLEDLLCVLDIIGYSLNNHSMLHSMINPEIDKDSFGLLGSPDITNLRILLSASQVKLLQPARVAQALYFLLESNLAYVEIRYEDSCSQSSSDVVSVLLHGALNVEQVLQDYNICLKSPLWFMNLAKDIVDKYNIDFKFLENTKVLGLLLENYIKGSYCDLTRYLNYQIYKIGSALRRATVVERRKAKDVDLFDYRNRLLCEITISNKDYRDTHLMDHFPTEDFIRILCTKDIDKFNAGTHKISYPKLCSMVDTGEVLKLERSKYTGKSHEK